MSPLDPPRTAPELPRRPANDPARRRRIGVAVAVAVAALLTLHLTLAVRSLLTENPTIDEVIHLPAGATYWQTGSFRMYPHNPPLIKMIAALPVVAARPTINYREDWWKEEPPNKGAFAHAFMRDNAGRYFELFTRARLLMPWFSVVGGLVVFAWSARLHGGSGGLLSLALWVLCPNVLAHARLVTSDLGSTALGVLASYVFWRYLTAPTWPRALLAGLCLGLAELTKFSQVVLYGLWPLMALVRLADDRASFRRLALRFARQGPVLVALSVLVIDAGYGFEGVGLPLGRYRFVCRTLTRPLHPGERNLDPLPFDAQRFRVNRFRGTALGALPAPLPGSYLVGFDDQKFEAEGVPEKFLKASTSSPEAETSLGYPVYLDGTLSQTSWWYYYLMTLVYKVPEGTLLLTAGSLLVLATSPRARASLFDEFAVLAVPAFVLFVMSVLTNINLGLRYVLPIFPYVFVSVGRLVPWAAGLSGRGARRAAWTFLGLCLSATAAATATIHPHYLAYFNAVSGGPDRGADHLIDSNLDWGQDLVALRLWLRRNAPGERVGLAYFGQINPRIFDLRGEGFDWRLPPPAPGTMPFQDLPPRYLLDPENQRLKPGLYAVSASLVAGIPWRVYDSPWRGMDQDRWAPRQAWFNAFGYFRELTPITKLGYSLWIYRVSAADAARLAHHWERPRGGH